MGEVYAQMESLGVSQVLEVKSWQAVRLRSMAMNIIHALWGLIVIDTIVLLYCIITRR
jgi:hypothetical protein